MGSSKKEVSERIKRFRVENDITIQQLSDKIGIPKGTIEKYLNKPSYPNVEFILAFTSAFGVTKDWLLEGIEPMLISPKEAIEGREFHTGMEFPTFVPIPRYSVGASAGHGSAVSDELAEGTYAFNQAWLDRRGLQKSNLSVISVAGNSMEPELYDRDLVLVDHASTELADSHIYAVRFSDALYVKRIQHQPGDKVLLISKNKDYPPIEIANPEADGVEVIGRIVASMHEW